jgi:hypothetical protein
MLFVPEINVCIVVVRRQALDKGQPPCLALVSELLTYRPIIAKQ